MIDGLEFFVDAREVREWLPLPDGSGMIEVRSFVATATSGEVGYAQSVSLPVDEDDLPERAEYELKRMTVDQAVAGLERELAGS